MTSAWTSILLLAALLATILAGRIVRRRLPEHHLSSDSRDAVKLAMGLVATMTALLLGILVGSAKGTYDAQRTEVIQMASQVSFLDHVLTQYGPEALEVRARFRTVVAGEVHRIWPNEPGARPQLASVGPAGDQIYSAVLKLSPRDDEQASLKLQAATLASNLGQLKVLLLEQTAPSIPRPLLVALAWWLVVIFLYFSLLAPPNATTGIALVAAATSVAVAVFLVMELDQPLGGFLRIPSDPMVKAMSHFTG